MKPDHPAPEMELAEPLVEEPPGRLGEPEVEAREHGRDRSARPARCGGAATTKYVSWKSKSSGGDATITPVMPADREEIDVPTAKSIAVVKRIWPPEHGGRPVEDLDSGRHRDDERGDAEEGRLIAPVVNMWCAQTDIE